MITRRIAKLEATKKKHDRDYVVYVQDGETREEALARFFVPYGGETWPVAVMPERCKTAEEWIEKHCPREH
jgi:hypothetical protein